MPTTWIGKYETTGNAPSDKQTEDEISAALTTKFSAALGALTNPVIKHAYAYDSGRKNQTWHWIVVDHD
jgi:hypothetical protein